MNGRINTCGMFPPLLNEVLESLQKKEGGGS